MNRLYIVTGAKGHLGNTIVRMLREEGQQVRGLILPSEEVEEKDGTVYIRGDVRDKKSLQPLFENTKSEAKRS